MYQHYPKNLIDTASLQESDLSVAEGKSLVSTFFTSCADATRERLMRLLYQRELSRCAVAKTMGMEYGAMRDLEIETLEMLRSFLVTSKGEKHEDLQ